MAASSRLKACRVRLVPISWGNELGRIELGRSEVTRLQRKRSINALTG